MIRNAMTVDVEDYFHVSAFADVFNPDDWDKCECRVERNTHSILDMFDGHAVKATFFVLGWVAERYPALVREIDTRGHEVACHGYSHQLVYNQSPSVFKQETARAKSILENQIQKSVFGYRAASYSITRSSMWAVDVLMDLGFTYDSSIFPVRHDRYGVPGSRRMPHYLRSPSGKSIAEFPLSTLEILGTRLPISGGGYFRLFPYWFTETALRHVNEAESAPFIFYLHPWEIDPEQPRVDAKWLSRFRHYNNLDKCGSRLEKLLCAFEFTTVRDVMVEMGMLELDGSVKPDNLAA